MWLPLFESQRDYSQLNVMIPLSAGINSMALLCYMATEYPPELRPQRVFIWYTHLREHSPDSLHFVFDGIRYAVRHFEYVRWCIKWGSVLDFFRGEKLIPHPIISPCSEHLKFGPMAAWARAMAVDVDLVGYIRNETRRIQRQEKHGVNGKAYPISHITEADCFALVDREIGWHPAIYDTCEHGKRVFRHNNCLPCKNMQGHLNGAEATEDFLAVQRYYPDYFKAAQKLACELDAYWGRDGDFDGYCKLCEDYA